MARPSAAEFVPATRDLESVAEASCSCRGCDRYRHGTRTVFGEGDPHARIMLVGEVPGDVEDREGHVFVGPAGRLLREIMSEAGIEPEATWLTNAVKHFDYELRGTKRIHLKPTMLEITACRPWLDAELELVRPEIVVVLGATAARSLLGSSFRITRSRGRWTSSASAEHVLATWHPSAVLRAPEHEDRERMRAEMLADLRKAAGGTG